MSFKKILLCGVVVTMLLTGCADNTTSTSTTSNQDVDATSSTIGSSGWTQAEAQIYAMDTIMKITANGTDPQGAVDRAESQVYELEDLFAVTDESSEISAINAGSGSAVEISDITADVISRALEMSDITGGIFNIAMYPIVKAWGFTTEEYQVPSDETIQALLQNVDYSQIKLAGNTVTLPEGMEIDVGGIAKGYAGDVARDTLKSNGITSALLNLGGDVQAVGSKPDGSDWRVAIQDPQSSDYICVLSVSDTTVMTSGSYERYFTADDGTRYCHIMDPSTGSPANNGLVSVTIVTDEGYMGDALATALFVMGVDEALEFWSNNDYFEALLLTENDELYVTEGIADSFELHENYEYLDVKVVEPTFSDQKK